MYSDETIDAIVDACGDFGSRFSTNDGVVREVLSALEETAEQKALRAFKGYVHQRLDDAGIPTRPEGEHSAAGCRIGDRLDILLARLSMAEHERDNSVECLRAEFASSAIEAARAGETK